MIIVHTRLPIKPEHKEEFLAHLANKQMDLQNFDGFVEMNVLKPINIPHMGKNDTFIIESKWQDMPSFMAYTKSEAFKKSHENLPPREWFAAQPSVEVYEA